MDTTRICDIKNGNFFLLNGTYYIKLENECLNLTTKKWEELYSDIHCKEIAIEEVFNTYNYVPNK